MRLGDFDFDLPEDRIALRPVRPRSAARLLVSDGGRIADRRVADLPGLLRPGDLLVLNDTKVIPARLSGLRLRDSADGTGAARVEATLLRRTAPDRWEALAKPGRKLRAGDRIAFGPLGAEVAGKGEAGLVTLAFDRAGPALDAAIATTGAMPLPPYIATARPPDAADREDYQTVFAARDGAVAAPTASLHFDPPLVAALDAAGVGSAFVTLHVGAGTFLPVTAEDPADHRMHAEWGEVSEAAAEAIRAARATGRRVLAIGTTALRLVETAAARGEVRPFRGETDLFIRPGFRFRAADGLMTNFHLPRSTLLMLVAAFVGLEAQRAIYAHALAGGYRFYSYGDASLLWP